MTVSLVANHCTTWHDGGAALLLSDGTIVALASERVGDRYKHSWNSRLAYDYLQGRYATNDKSIDLFIDCSDGLQQDNHHLYHAEAAFFQSGFDSSAVLVIDGQGPGHGHLCTASIWQADGSGLNILDDVLTSDSKFADQSLGHFYTAITALSGFQELNTEGSAMALAAFGAPSEFAEYFRKFIAVGEDCVSVDPALTRSILGHTYGQAYYDWDPPTEVERKIWRDLGSMRQTSGNWPTQDDMDIAWAGQQLLQEAVVALARRAKRLTNQVNLCLVGGVALNCVSNENLARQKVFDNVFVPSAPGDDGQAVGRLVHEARERDLTVQQSNSPFLGPIYFEYEIAAAVESHGYRAKAVSESQLLATAVDKLASGRLIGWSRGRSEWGPRALGNRSILGDPREASTRDKLNLIKGRQGFRPVAPIVLEHEVQQYFDAAAYSPYMSFAAQSTDRALAEVPAVVHVDGSSRLQILTGSADASIAGLVHRFHKSTGVPMLVSTSFNGQGMPMVETPHDAFRAALELGLDDLVLDGHIIEIKT